MKPRFNEAKATQAAALLLKLRGGTMRYMKLLKLLYLIDRTALIRWGRPVTYDSYFSLPRGPILSQTLNLITEGVPPEEPSMWTTCISEPSNYNVSLKQECSTDELSQAEEDLIREIFDEYGHMNRWELVEFLHKELPEWQNPGCSSLSIEYRDILKAGGKTDIEIARIEAEIEGLALFDEMVR
ncbi:MAG: SocA family protein [Acidobacteria bacterium]|nr:SocA family protein [Acidobacteriota bacterium]